MNFEQWFNPTPYEKYHKGRHISEKTWDACKQEILKILNDKNNHSWYDTESGGGEAIDMSVIKEIERL